MTPPPRLYQSAFGAAIVAALCLTHYLAWNRGRAEATLRHTIASAAPDLERTIREVSVDKIESPASNGTRDRLLADLGSLTGSVEAEGFPAQPSLTSEEVSGLVRRARQLESQLEAPPKR